MAKSQYGPAHKALRKAWAPIVASGQATCCEVVCVKGSRIIDPDEPWDLAHTEDGTDYRGPAHEACNRSEGATRGNRQRAEQHASMWRL